MNINFKLYVLIFINYIAIFKIFKEDLFIYIIHPSVMIIFSIIAYIFFYKEKYYKNKNICLYEVIKMILLYILLYYGAGLFIDYTNSPYASDAKGIIINIFSILLVLGLKEFIRGTLINGVFKNKILYLSLICIIFIIFDINFLLLKDSFNSISNFITTLIIYIVPIISINIFCIYLSINGSFIISILYRCFIMLAMLIIPVVPKYVDIVPALFDILTPFFTFLLIRHKINTRSKHHRFYEDIIPRKWILSTISLIIFLFFIIGLFPLKPVVILSGSMKPTLKEGDLLIIKKCNINEVKPNDIIEFNKGKYNVVHRAIKVVNNNNDINLITKGDNNTNEDDFLITNENLRGCFSIKIPYVGYPVYIIRTLLINKK